MSLFHAKLIANNIRAPQPNNPRDHEHERLYTEIRSQGDQRCEECSGYGHCASGIGRDRASRAATKCPNPTILARRLGTGTISKQTRRRLQVAIRRSQLAMLRAGRNGGGIRNGRQIGRFDENEWWRWLISAVSAYFAQAAPANPNALTAAEADACRNAINGL